MRGHVLCALHVRVAELKQPDQRPTPDSSYTSTVWPARPTDMNNHDAGDEDTQTPPPPVPLKLPLRRRRIESLSLSQWMC